MVLRFARPVWRCDERRSVLKYTASAPFGGRREHKEPAEFHAADVPFWRSQNNGYGAHHVRTLFRETLPEIRYESL